MKRIFSNTSFVVGCFVLVLSLWPSSVRAQGVDDRPRTRFSGLFAFDLVDQSYAGFTAGLFYGPFGVATELIHPYAHPDVVHPELALYLATEVPVSSALLTLRLGVFVETHERVLGMRVVAEFLMQERIGPYVMLGASFEPEGWSVGNEGDIPLSGRVGLSTRLAPDVYLILFGGLKTADRLEHLDGLGGLALQWLVHGHAHVQR